LESATIMSIKEEDLAAFERNITQLKVYYNSFGYLFCKILNIILCLLVSGVGMNCQNLLYIIQLWAQDSFIYLLKTEWQSFMER